MANEFASGIRASEDVIFHAVEDQIVLLNLQSQRYYELDSVGSRVWGLLLEYGNVESVAARICEEYEVERSQVLCDVESLIRNFQSEGLIAVH